MFESLPFPPELFLHIFLWLAPRDLARVAQCNQAFYHLANDDHFWGTLTARDFGQHAAFFKRETTSRKENYKNRFRFEKILARLEIDRSNQSLINALYEDDISYITPQLTKTPEMIGNYIYYTPTSEERDWINLFGVTALFNCEKMLTALLQQYAEIIPWAFKTPDFHQAFHLASVNGSTKSLAVIYALADKKLQAELITGAKFVAFRLASEQLQYDILEQLIRYAEEQGLLFSMIDTNLPTLNRLPYPKRDQILAFLLNKLPANEEGAKARALLLASKPEDPKTAVTRTRARVIRERRAPRGPARYISLADRGMELQRGDATRRYLMNKSISAYTYR